MDPSERKVLALEGLARREPLSELARAHEVSRKFVYAQVEKAGRAVDQAFSEAKQEPEDVPLFYLPVTKRWIQGFTVSLGLSCHAPYRGIKEVLLDQFGYDIAIGTIHNTLHEAVVRARAVLARENLSGIRVGAHDEIFQGDRPVLTGVDVHSLYCYLLSLEEHRDGDTWGVRLLELRERGLHPDHTIADFGSGLRAGQTLAWEDVPCDGDVFHALQEMSRQASYLENRAFGAMTERESLERKMERSKKHRRGNKLSGRLACARAAEEEAVSLADDIALLTKWLHEDVLCLVGPDLETRRTLLHFLTEELKAREKLAPHRIAPMRSLLENQGEALLAFVARIDDQLKELASSFQVDPRDVRSLYDLQGFALDDTRRYEREFALRKRLRHAFYPLERAIHELLEQTVRASSAVENLNSRLREYFFLRRHLGPDYLELLRFYLNHHRFPRSEKPERAGKSPAEILEGRTLPHWLEQIGFSPRFEDAEDRKAVA
jgi:hypothetical protein